MPTTAPQRSRLPTAVVAAAIAAAAVPALAADADAAGERTLQLLTFNSPEQVQPVIDAWAVEHPDVAIEVQTVPFADLNAVVQSRVGDGDPDVDVFLVDQPRLAAFADRGLLLDLTDHVDVDEGTVLPTALEATRFDDRLYALPVQTSTQLLFSNPGLLAAAGAPEPSTDPGARMSWETVVEQGAAAQEQGAEWGLIFEQGATPYQVLPLVWSLGGGDGLAGDDALTPDLTDDGWIAAMTWFAGVHADGVAPRGMGFGVSTETFAAGEAAYFLAGPWNLAILDGMDLDFEYGVAAHPMFDGGEAFTPTGSFGWGVNPASDNVADAVDLVEFVALDPAGGSAVAAGDPNIPTNIEALDAYLAGDLFQVGSGVTVADLIRHELDTTARLRPISTAYVEFETIVGAALEDIRNGLDVESTLETAEAELAATIGS